MNSVLARNWFKRVCNEIHKMKNPSEALPSQVFQVVAKSNQRGKGWQRAHFASRPDHRGHIRSPKGTMPFGEAYVYSENTGYAISDMFSLVYILKA